MTDIGAAEEPDISEPGLIQRCTKSCQMRWQHLMDQLTPFITVRWVVTAVLFVSFCTRILLAQGWYVVAYALGVYLLSLLVLFLAPQIDPATQNDEARLPTKATDEFRPFMRRLPEFRFWLRSTRAIFVSLCLTFFDVFNLPVFWPILVMYFVMLFAMTMRRQLQHMIQYNYLPWSRGKVRYEGKPDT